MKNLFVTATAALTTLAAGSALANPGVGPLIYGLQAEQLEYRFGEGGDDVLVWDFDAIVGDDELRFVFRSEAEMETSTNDFETLENQFRLQRPISTFFDAVVGARASTPSEGPNRYSLVLGVKGLAPQWFEIDADVFLSEYPFGRFEAEYEVLLTNRLNLVPSIEINMPFKDDVASLQSAGGATIEIGARLGYDLLFRAVSPYVGVNYERSYGGTGDLIEAAGGQRDNFSVVVGTRLFF
ncbi:MAG: copper resistance protein CopB [Rhodobacteraceae bacterium]|nr:copper resistance protein CopB [Paracoccaceae bacterium]MBO28022.1 copper resistance protein CopB [Paracoccaceae bacterium]